MSIPAPNPMFAPVRTLHQMSAEAFDREIVPAARPVLIKGFFAGWPAVGKASAGVGVVADYLKSLDNGQPTPVLEASHATRGRFTYAEDMSEFNFSKRNRSISAAIDQILGFIDHPNPPYVYVQSVMLSQHLPAFVAENPNPLLPSSVSPRIWIGNATRAQTHNDNSHNLACVTAGRRRFTLFPPEQLTNLYIGPIEHNPAGRAISLASLEDPDFETYPRLAEAFKVAEVAELEPGDALYIPKYWWHHVQSMTPFNVLVNYWWDNAALSAENPMVPFLSALYALRDMPEAEKRYWKTMLDYYVFQVEGDPVGHIPSQHQGGLGRHTPRIRAEILHNLQNAVNGRR